MHGGRWVESGDVDERENDVGKDHCEGIVDVPSWECGDVSSDGIWVWSCGDGSGGCGWSGVEVEKGNVGGDHDVPDVGKMASSEVENASDVEDDEEICDVGIGKRSNLVVEVEVQLAQSEVEQEQVVMAVGWIDEWWK